VGVHVEAAEQGAVQGFEDGHRQGSLKRVSDRVGTHVQLGRGSLFGNLGHKNSDGGGGRLLWQVEHARLDDGLSGLRQEQAAGARAWGPARRGGRLGLVASRGERAGQDEAARQQEFLNA